MLVLVFGDVFTLPAPFDDLLGTKEAEAAQVTIDNSAATVGTDHTTAGPTLVFVSDTQGYKFYRDGGNTCVYSRTLDAGNTWGTATTVDSQPDCSGIAVWYDRWTPGDMGTNIHIATYDANPDHVWYNALDTTTDTRLVTTAIDASLNSAQTGTLASGGNTVTITKGTDGTKYIGMIDNTDSYVVECTTGCGVTTGWTETGTNPMTNAINESIIMAPLVGGNIMLINRNVAATPDKIQYKIWNNSIWSAAWTNLDQNAPTNLTYDVGMSVLTSSTTGQLYLAYTADNFALGTDDDVRVGIYNGTSWATSTPVLNDAKGITAVSIGLDQNDDTVYIAYTAATTPATPATQNVYYKTSSSTMQSWSAEVGPLNSGADDLYGVSLSGITPQRIFVTWFDGTDDDIFGDTIFDTAPGLRLGTTTAQTAQARATSTNFYVGGAFSFYENFRARNITSLTIAETGSIDGQTGLGNIKLQYESDATYPYNCASVAYDGSETQFGSIDSDGFPGPNGTSTFTDTVAVGTTSALCVYPVMNILNTAVDLTTIDIEITNPVSDVLFTLGNEILPTTTVAITGSTTVYNDDLSLTHFHWRNDDGSESGATSATGDLEDTHYNAYPFNTTKRLRVEVSNEGSTTTLPQQYRLEYAPKTFICAQETGWVDVGASGGDWDMSDTVNLTNGNDTSNVALASNGAVTDSNTVFLGSNGGQRDTSSQTGLLTLGTTSFAELEYSVIASTTAIAGTSYCFRLTDAGAPLDAYDFYPQATIASDVLLTASGTQKEWLDIPSTNSYIGGQFILQKQTVGSVSISSVTIMASGSVDYQNDLDNIRLQYDLDITAPYDCSSESYSSGDTQYGVQDTDGFSATATAAFYDSVSLSQTQSMCIYTVLDVATTSTNGELLDIQIGDPETDIVRSAGTIGPSNTLRILGNTEFVGDIPTQIHYQFRNDDGSETTATSKTNGSQDTNIATVQNGTTTRLRIEISNEGGTTTPGMQYRLEYAIKVSSCAATGNWTDVGAGGGDWDMSPSANLTDGSNTTNIAVIAGGVFDENAIFLAANAGQKDTSSQTSSLVLATSSFVELEYSIISSSTIASDNSVYCFRVTDAGVALPAYSTYPEVGIRNISDFKVQRGVSVVGDTGIGTRVLTAGVDYVAPAASTSAFIRITNTQHTGAGATTSTATQNADDVSVYILNPWNIRTSVTFQRQTTGPVGSSRFAWEIVEYVGPAGGDNEIIVRQQQAMTFGTASTSASGTPFTGVVDNNDVAVFITGVWNPDIIATNYNSMLVTSVWSGTTSRAGFNRDTTGSDAVRVSYAVIEFTGANWKVQRAQHAYTSTSSVETENITAVNSLARTFLHTQHRAGTNLISHANFGHEVWLSSVGAVSFRIDGHATNTPVHTSVAWVIENTQSAGDSMIVTRSNGTQAGGVQPLAVNVSIGKTLADLTIASIFTNNRSTGSGTPTFPEPIMMVSLMSTSTTDYQLWVSNTGETRTYRTEVVEWPTARRTIAQNYYRLYTNNNALIPTTAWPASGGLTLGENTAMTGVDEPTSNGSVVRLRMSLNVNGLSSMPPGIDAFKLQYGKRTGVSCSAITTWQNIGDNSSTTALWRGANTPIDDGTILSGNPPTGGHLLLSVSDRAGTYEEANDTPLTSYSARVGEDMEFDWALENNNADERASYCFRMIESNGTELSAYNFYPTVRTVGYGAESKNWRWYDDAQNEAPTSPLALETITPIDVSYNNVIALRLTLKESNGATGTDVKFKLQFSESPTFDSATDVAGTSTCADNTSYWCYAVGGGLDNAVIGSSTLTDAELCTSGVGRGCGTHNASGTSPATYDQPATSSAEFSFSLRHAGARANRTYYFRAFDVTNNEAIVTAIGESYPSLTTQGATLSFAVSGIATSTVVEGVTTDITTTPTAIPFGTFTGSSTKNAAYQLTVNTDATEGYQVFVFQRQSFLSNTGNSITPVAASNTSPIGWATACNTSFNSCFGYHAGDDTLAGGSARFAPNDTYAALETAPREVAQSSIPVINDQVNVIYRVTTRNLQEAGQYATNLVYIVVPIF